MCNRHQFVFGGWSVFYIEHLNSHKAEKKKICVFLVFWSAVAISQMETYLCKLSFNTASDINIYGIECRPACRDTCSILICTKKIHLIVVVKSYMIVMSLLNCNLFMPWYRHFWIFWWIKPCKNLKFENLDKSHLKTMSPVE